MKGFPKHSGIGGVQAEKELKAEVKSMAADKPKTTKTEKPTETYEQWAKRAPGTAQWVSEDEYEDMVRTTKSNIKNYPGDSSGFKMKGYSAFDKEDPKTMRVEVASVGKDGGTLMVNTDEGVRKVKGGAAGIAEIKAGDMVTVNVGGGGMLTLDAKAADDEATHDLRKKKTKASA